MKTTLTKIVTVEGASIFFDARRIEVIKVVEAESRPNTVIMTNGSCFNIDTNTANGLIDLLKKINQSAITVNQSIEVRSSPLKQEFTYAPMEVPTIPYAYAANLDDESLARWLSHLSNLILAKNDILKRIESDKESGQVRIKKLSDINAELLYSIRR
ncbi:hypothetical protein LH413_21380 [Yersinia massiliensis]|uniref:hypothetical protein n=1 Tax=Yersinia massiliensis TaxID=419257 RepID=UPI001CFC565A|nr:hypothetical protein [Yersinia massiliensis]MCB5320041.1 hypothetical protein [Yersinia massiliensis]